MIGDKHFGLDLSMTLLEKKEFESEKKKKGKEKMGRVTIRLSDMLS